MSLNNIPLILFLIFSYLKLCIDFPPALNFCAPASQQLHWILLSKCTVVKLSLLCGCCSHPLRYITLFVQFLFVSPGVLCVCLCVYFLLYNKVNQLYVYICPLFFGFPSQCGHHRELNRVPSRFLFIICFIHSINHRSPNSPHAYPLPLGLHAFVLSICVSISALQIRSSIPFF